MSTRPGTLTPALLTGLLLVAGAPPLPAQEWGGPGRITGRVLDERRKPVADAVVRLYPVEDPREGPPPLTTDETGRWSYLGLATGEWIVSASAQGLIPGRETVEVKASGTGQTVRLILRSLPAETLEILAANEARRELMLANGMLLAENYVEAREAFEALAPSLEPDLKASALYGVALTWEGEGDPEETLLAIERALEVDPEHLPSLKLACNLLIAQGREREAEHFMARLPEDEPLAASAYVNVGIARYNHGDLDGAMRYFEQVVSTYPEEPDGYFYRGVIHLSRGASDLAIADLRKVLELDPRSPHLDSIRDYLEYLDEL